MSDNHKDSWLEKARKIGKICFVLIGDRKTTVKKVPVFIFMILQSLK